MENDLSLRQLEEFDAHAPASGVERRFLCPLCGESKPRDAAHRCLCANVQNGAWNCKRCHASGKLREFWSSDADAPAKPLESARRRRALLSALPTNRRQSTVESGATDARDWREQLSGVTEIAGTPGAAYLQSRGITIELACDSTVLFAPHFYGRPAVVFMLRDFDGQPTGASGRYFHFNATPKTRIAGNRRDGVFQASVTLGNKRVQPFDAAAPAIIITEAPIDALSLAMAGYPALALCGTSAPHWIHRACGLRRVLLAHDADAAGDAAAASLEAVLAPYGARCTRLRPEAAKDWNEVLKAQGRENLSDWLAPRVLAA